MKSKSFRLAAKKVFLTFPSIDSNLDFDSIFHNLESRFLNLSSVIIAKEAHQDNSTHFHIFIEFQNKLDTRDPNFFDFIFNKHGNYQAVKNFKQTLNYITKEQHFKEYLSEYTKAPLSLLHKIRFSLEKLGAKPLDLFADNNHPLRDTIFQHASKIETYHRRYQAFLHEQELLKKQHVLTWDTTFLLSNASPELLPYARNICPILNFLNLYMVKSHRRYKSPNLLI
jgi:hypothetical protein